ncbi:MAG: hypothetical protein NTZ94_01950 [Verrucomicrobia bacterium]|nr:hypothetical protein [Verrucomicrobiota bacterium]
MKFPRFLLVLLLSATLAGADTIREAIVNHCDPAKIATITSERGANPRVRKICYWLEMARLDGRDPAVEMREVMDAVGWGGTAKGELTAEAMVRNRVIADAWTRQAWPISAVVVRPRFAPGLMLATS